MYSTTEILHIFSKLSPETIARKQIQGLDRNRNISLSGILLLITLFAIPCAVLYTELTPGVVFGDINMGFFLAPMVAFFVLLYNLNDIDHLDGYDPLPQSQCSYAAKVFRRDPMLIEHLNSVVKSGRVLTVMELNLAEQYLKIQADETSCKELYGIGVSANSWHG